MASEFFRKFLQRSQCSDCGVVMLKGVIIDWVDQSPWCADCFKLLLEDRRKAEQAE